MSSSKKSAGCPAPVSYGTDAEEAPARTWQLQLQEAVDLLDAAHEAFPSSAEGGGPARAAMRCASEKLDELFKDLKAHADADAVPTVAVRMGVMAFALRKGAVALVHPRGVISPSQARALAAQLGDAAALAEEREVAAHG